MTWTNGVLRRVLPNGLTLLLQRDASAPVVAVVTHVRAGYFDEPDEWVGIAHVLEHMYFKGTARRGPGEIARETQLLGGYINAGTIYDKTVYYTVLPSAAGGLERALDVQADALMHAALDAAELARELEVIIQEAKRKLDTPSAVAAESLYALLFDVHRMRRWRIGTEEGLRRLTPESVHAYYGSRYAPGRVVVGIVGDLDPERAADAAEALYGNWRLESAPVEGSPPEPHRREARLKILHGDVERPIVELGWRTVDAMHPDAPALDLAAAVLGAGRGSTLYRTLRRPGIAASAGASHYSPTEVGVFGIGLEADANRLDVGVRGALAAAGRLGADGPGDAEMARAHALLDAQWLKRLEGAEGRASLLCEAEALGDVALVDEFYERERAVTAGDVRRVAEHHLTRDAVCAVLYLPENLESPIVEWPAEPETPEVPGTRSSAVRRAGGTATARRQARRRVDGVEHVAFPGADLLLRTTPGSGLATLQLHFPGVPGQETAETAGLSWLLARSAMRGAAGMDGDALAQAAERLGGGIAPAVGAESLGWGMTVRAAALGEAAELLRAVAAEPSLDPAEVLVERDLQVSDARRVRDDMFRYPLQRALGAAFPEDSYGLPRLGDPDVVAGFEPARVRGWADALPDRRAVVVAVGDVDPEAAIDALTPLLAWGGTASGPVHDAGPTWHAGRGAEHRQREQTAFAMAFPSAPFASDDRYGVIVLGSLLSGLAGRLFDELREKRSLAYTVAAMPWLARRAGAVLCYIATSPEREEEARNGMLAELRRVVTEPPDEVELSRARNYTAGSVEVRRQTGRAQASEILEAWVHGALDALPGVAERLRAVSLDEVLRAAAALGDDERRAEYVVRGGKD